MGVSLLANFNLWSARTAAVHAAVYTGSFVIGTLLGTLAARYGALHRRGRFVVLSVGGLGVAYSVYTILYVPYDLAGGLLAHAAGCFGLSAIDACGCGSIKEEWSVVGVLQVQQDACVGG